MNVYWLEQTEADVPIGNQWLTSSEALRLSALAYPKRRADWRLGRWTAKQAIREILKNRSPAELEIRAGASGAPEVWFEDRRSTLTISLSHRCGVACCAVAQVPAALGCDLEVNETHSRAFVADYFNAAEQAWIAQGLAAEATEVSALLWSAKESALKALGVGLREDTRSIAVQEDSFSSWPCLGAWRRLHVRHGERELHGWWRADEQFVRTLVADPPPHAPNERQAPEGARFRVSDWSNVYDVI